MLAGIMESRTDCQVTMTTREDLPAVQTITNWYIENTHANFSEELVSLADLSRQYEAEHEQYPWLVARCGPDIVGFAYATRYKGRCAYRFSAEVSVYLEPRTRGRGLGTALYDRLLGILDAQGYRTLIAGIAKPNPASEALHQRFGFEPVGVFRGVGYKFEQWHDVGYWQRTARTDSGATSLLTVEAALRTLEPRS